VFWICHVLITRSRTLAFQTVPLPFWLRTPRRPVPYFAVKSGKKSSFKSQRLRPCGNLYASSSSSNNKKNKKNSNDKPLTAAERERRDEERRRQERKDDVVINKTSAKKGAKDYPLDIKATEQQYLKQASRMEQEIYHLTEKGLEALNNLQLQEADKAFERVFQLKPNAYLWQAGIVKFYLGDIQEAANIFKRNAELFEAKFGGQPASEERIWRDACELKYWNSLIKKEQKKLIKEEGGMESIMPRIVDQESDNEVEDDFMAFAMSENRKVIKLTRELFSAAVEMDKSAASLAKAKLSSIGGTVDPNGAIVMDRKSRKLTSLFYLGLYHDVVGEIEESKKCFKMALMLNPSIGKSLDIVQTLPLLHMTVRDWFDDDLFGDDDLTAWEDEDKISETTEEEDSFETTVALNPPLSPLSKSKAYSDTSIESSILADVNKLTFAELKDSLRIRGVKTTGSKQLLRDRLFFSLMEDAGFQSGFAP
jgi:hypothetical protein